MWGEWEAVCAPLGPCSLACPCRDTGYSQELEHPSCRCVEKLGLTLRAEPDRSEGWAWSMYQSRAHPSTLEAVGIGSSMWLLAGCDYSSPGSHPTDVLCCWPWLVVCPQQPWCPHGAGWVLGLQHGSHGHRPTTATGRLSDGRAPWDTAELDHKHTLPCLSKRSGRLLLTLLGRVVTCSSSASHRMRRTYCNLWFK